MTHAELSSALRRLPLGGRLELSRAAVGAALVLEISTIEGRSALYALSDIHRCRLEWDDAVATVAFIKRPEISFR